MKSTLMRTIRISLICIFLFLSSYSQAVQSALQPTQKKIGPLLQQAISTKRVSPDKAVAAVEYYSADKSPIKSSSAPAQNLQ